MAGISSLNFRLTANIKPFRTNLNKAERAMDRMGRKMQQTGKNLSMKLTAPITALGAISFNVFKNFEAEMAKVQAVSGATAEEFESLSKNAKDLGASTMFSAREVASLQTEFAKLGFTATEITKVTEATLALAQASGSDLARAAEVAGSTLRAFGMDASETGRVTDVMAMSFSSSALDMETFAESMKFVAPVAKSAGMSLEETSAMLSVLANAGIKGSKAGTALRRIISEIGATGKPTVEAIADLASKGLDLADAKDEVGRSAQSALLVLANGVNQIAPTTQALQNSAGAAKEMADIMGDTAFGASKRLESAMEGLGISIGEIIAVAVVPLIEGFASLASKLNNLNPSAKRFAVVIAALAAAAGPLVFITGGLLRNFRFLKVAILRSNTATKAAIVLQRALNVVMKANPMGIVIGAVTALAGAFLLLNRRQKETEEINKGLSESAKEEIADNQVRLSQANNLIDTINDQNVSNEQRSRLINRLNTEYKDLLPNLIDEKDSVDDIAKAQREMNKEMAKKIAMIAAQDEMNQAVKDAVDAQKAYNEALKSTDDLATESTEMFGRVLSDEEAQRIVDLGKTMSSEVTPAQVDFANALLISRNALQTQKIALDDANTAVVEVGKSVDQLAKNLTSAADSGEGDADRIAEALVSIPRKAEPAFIGFMPMMENVRREFVNFTAMAIQAGNAMKNVFAKSLVDAFGELDKGETKMGKFKESMGRMLKDMVIQFLAAAAAAFLLAVAVRFAMGGFGMSGLQSIGGFKDIFGTMQSVGGFMSNIPMLAEGGIVTGPTLAMVGEGGQSEAVIPLDRLHEFGGNGAVEVYGRLSGSDILLSTERAQRTRTRQRGF